MTDTDSKKTGRIYQMVNMITNEKYVGATFSPLHKRLYQRKARYERWLRGQNESDTKLFRSIHEYGWESFRMELLEEVNVKNKQELFKIEGEWIRKLDTFKNGLNSKIEGQKKKEWYRKNQVKRLKQMKKWIQNNRDKVVETRQKWKQKVECECGCSITRKYLSKHLKTKKHQQNIKSNSDNESEDYLALYKGESDSE